MKKNKKTMYNKMYKLQAKVKVKTVKLKWKTKIMISKTDLKLISTKTLSFLQMERKKKHPCKLQSTTLNN